MLACDKPNKCPSGIQIPVLTTEIFFRLDSLAEDSDGGFVSFQAWFSYHRPLEVRLVLGTVLQLK
jgi:hypothetical protein